MDGDALETLARQMGINSQQVVRKAAEYMRLAEIRYGSSSLAAVKPSGSCKAVMCLQLAAVACGQNVDKNHAIRMSGMNKKMFGNAMRALERLLDLQPSTSIPELTVQFNCPNVRPLALQVLKLYETDHQKGDNTELCQSLFNSAAIYSVARKMKAKIDKNKVVEVSGVRKSTFDRLVAQMDKCAEKLLAETQQKKPSGEKRTKTLIEEMELLQDYDENEELAKRQKTSENHLGDQEDDYEEWKEKILEAAYNKLNKARPR